jgi:uncharacterized protein YqiB (DUF1249 family)
MASESVPCRDLYKLVVILMHDHARTSNSCEAMQRIRRMADFALHAIHNFQKRARIFFLNELLKSCLDNGNYAYRAD